MNIRRLLLRTAAICTTLVVLAFLTVASIEVSHHLYDTPTVKAARAAARACAMQNFGQDTVSIAGPNVVCFHSSIDDASAKRFLDLPVTDGSMMVLQSSGGLNEAALVMVDRIMAKHLVAVVDSKCLSACANYLFPAAASKIVLDGGIVGFHGGLTDGPYTISITLANSRSPLPTNDELQRDFTDYKSKTPTLLIRQARFYQKIGANEDVIDKSPLKLYRSQFKFENSVWEYGPDTLRDKFGIKNILYFPTPDKAGLFGRVSSYLNSIHCKPDGTDVWFCKVA